MDVIVILNSGTVRAFSKVYTADVNITYERAFVVVNQITGSHDYDSGYSENNAHYFEHEEERFSKVEVKTVYIDGMKVYEAPAEED